MSIQVNSDGDVTWALDGSRVINSAGISIITGWWNFSLIATDNSLWSSGSHTLRLNSGAPPSMDLVVDSNLSDYTYLVTLPITITTGEWYFLATVIRGGAAPAVKVFFGTPTSEPVECTTALSSGSGSFVSSTNFRLGGVGASGTYMDGYVSNVSAITMVCDTTLALNTDILFDKYIHPLYLGTFDAKTMLGLPDGTALGPSTSARVDAVRWFPCNTLSNSQYTSFQNVKQESAAVTQATWMSTAVSGTTLFSNVEVPATRLNKVLTAYSDRPMATRR